MKSLADSVLIFGVLLSLCLSVSGCIGPYGFQTGRALGKKGAGEMVLDLDFLALANEESFDALPLGGFSGRMGISEKTDIGLVISLESLSYIYGRYQVLGNQHSAAALSLGLGGGAISTTSIDSHVYLLFPAWFSLHKGDFAWYLNPQWSLFWTSKQNDFTISPASRLYVSTGIEYFVTPDIALLLNAGYAKLPESTITSLDSAFTFGLGFKVVLGK